MGPRRGPDLCNLGLIENGSVLIENGVIRAVGPTRRIENLKESRNALVIDVSGSILMPGLVDAACHVTLPDATSLHSRARRPGRVYADVLELMRACLQHGTTAAVAMASAGGCDFKTDVSIMRQLNKVGNNPVHMVRSWDLPCWPETQAEAEDYRGTADVLIRRKLLDCVQISSQMHRKAAQRVAEALPESVSRGITWAGAEGVSLDIMLENFHPRSVLCQAKLTDTSIETLANWEGVCVFAPTPHLAQLGSSQVREAADAGCAIALASGYHTTKSPGYSMQMAITLAVINGRLTPEEAICGATINSAWAAGRSEWTGTLEKGKAADILVMSVPDYREIPRQFGINNVATVLRRGELVFNRARWRIGTHETGAGEMRT